MAIIPRTIFSHPRHLMVFLLTAAIIAGAAVGAALVFKKYRSAHPPGAYSARALGQLKDQREARRAFRAAQRAQLQKMADEHQLKARAQSTPAGCALSRPRQDWRSAEWARRLGCMEQLDHPPEALLEESDLAIEASGLSVELALKKSAYLARLNQPDAQIEFLAQAIDELGDHQGLLFRPLFRALVWRADRADFPELVRLDYLALTTRAPDQQAQCQALHTQTLARLLRAQGAADDAAARGEYSSANSRLMSFARRGARTYFGAGCAERIHQGDWEILAEIAGVALAVEATHHGEARSDALSEIARSFLIRDIPEFCRAALPDRIELRENCEKRVGDELFLARRP